MENQSTNRRLVTGMFNDKESAERAYNSINDRGYTKDDVHVIMSDKTRDTHFANETVETELGNKALKGAGTGSAIGTTLGAIGGVVAAIGTSLLIPGLGLVVAGPLVAGLAGAGAGAAAGGIVGALIGAGIPEERAKIYEDGVKKGNIVIGVHPRNEEDAAYFANDWQTNNGQEIHS
jgi:hypothetical protein